MKLTKLKAYILDSFWFKPLIISLCGILLSELLVQIESLDSVGEITYLFNLGADGARSILTTIGASILGVAAMSFSLTATTIATVSSSYGARLVRNFMTNNKNQIVLGVFSGTFLYCVWTLRYIHSINNGGIFIPNIAVHGAIVLAIICVIVLIYFIHQIAENTQISTLLSQARNDINESIDIINPKKEDRKTKNEAIKNFNSCVIKKGAEKEGYLQMIDANRLSKVAEDCGIKIKVVVEPGDYVHKNKDIFAINKAVSKSENKRILNCFSIGDFRTPHQDIRFAFQQPVDVACRALSPGINDPFTAMSAIDIIESGVIEYLKQPKQQRFFYDSDEKLNVFIDISSKEDVINNIYKSLDTYCMDDPRVKEKYLAFKKNISNYR